MDKKECKKYSSPELDLQLFVECDVITASNDFDENQGGIPEEWLSGEQGGFFQ